jgi:predicted secreted protein
MVAGIVHGAVLISAFAGFFFLALFCLLPVGLGEPDPHTGAPPSPSIGRKVLIALAIAAVLWVVFDALIVLKIIDL